MKRKLLSLALVLALCLSLAVPALAAEPSIYETGTIRVTNVLDHQEDGAGIFFTCVAPARFSPGVELVQESSSARAYRIPDGVQVATDNYDYIQYATEGAGAPVTTNDGNSVILTEPGWYVVNLSAVFVDISGGAGDGFFLVHVQAPENAGAGAGFDDVKAGDWFYEAVQWAVEKNITTGTSATTFSPLDTCTMAQILTFLWRAAGSPEAAPVGRIDPSAYYAKAVAWAAEKGILDPELVDVNGLSEPCDRGMAIWLLWMAAGQPYTAARPAFTDLGDAGDLAAAVAWAVEQGVTTGTSATTFDPGTICNRGHIVTFLYRAFAA